MIKEKTFLKAFAICLAYQEQIKQKVDILQQGQINKNVPKYKRNDEIEIGDFVEVVEVHSHSKNNLTKGKSYEVVNIHVSYNQQDKQFFIITDLGKKKFYNAKNAQFKALL